MLTRRSLALSMVSPRCHVLPAYPAQAPSAISFQSSQAGPHTLGLAGPQHSCAHVSMYTHLLGPACAMHTLCIPCALGRESPLCLRGDSCSL